MSTNGGDSGARVIEIDIAVAGVAEGDTGRDIERLDAAVHALDDVDLEGWSDTALSGHLDRLSLVLCRVDAQVSRLAEAVRSRGFSVREVELPLAS
jgi:hypothetical protein